MRIQYAVEWQEGDERRAGLVELGQDALLLRGRAADTGSARELPYERIRTVRRGDAGDAVGGRDALVIEEDDGTRVRVAAVPDAHLLAELTRRLGELRLRHEQHRRSLVVVVPLRPGTHADARALLAQGPPFDPEAARLIRHEALLTETAAVFFFEAHDAVALDDLVADPAVLTAAAGWRGVASTGPELAEVVYSWPGET